MAQAHEVAVELEHGALDAVLGLGVHLPGGRGHRQPGLAVDPAYQRRGLGRSLIEFVADRARGRYDALQVGTGDSPLTVPFYEACGFVWHHRVENFFPDNYDHPIVEAGVLLKDMVYLRREL